MLAAGSSVMSMEWLASAARHLALRDQAAQEEQRTGELREEPQELQAPVDSPAKTAAKDTQLDAAVPPPPAPESHGDDAGAPPVTEPLTPSPSP